MSLTKISNLILVLVVSTHKHCNVKTPLQFPKNPLNLHPIQISNMTTSTSQKTATENQKITSHDRETQTHTLEITNLHAEIDDQEILKGINLTIKSGEIHAIMGPNGSGKSTLCKVLMGHPKYEVTKGSAKFNGEEILEMETDERAKLGLFLGFQQPLEIPGVSLGNFLRLAKNAQIKANDPEAQDIRPAEFVKTMSQAAETLKMEREFIGRSVNEGFSGGEKKRAEIMQMSILEPKIALLDEIDSGLDIDALKIVSEGILDALRKSNCGVLLITHYQRILNYVEPNFVHIMQNGKITKSGGKKLAQELEEKGYEEIA